MPVSNFRVPPIHRTAFLPTYLPTYLTYHTSQVSATMARLKKEAEKRAKTLWKERAARAAERRDSRRAKKKKKGDDTPSPGSPHSADTSRHAGGGGTQEGDEGEDDGGMEEGWEEEEDEDEEEEEEEEEEEFDPQEGLLFVYVCTHAAVVTKGKGVAGTYFVTTDTSWKSKEQLAKTAVPLETFSASLAGIQVRSRRKAVQVILGAFFACLLAASIACNKHPVRPTDLHAIASPPHTLCRRRRVDTASRNRLSSPPCTASPRPSLRKPQTPHTPRLHPKSAGLEKLRHKVVFLDVVHTERVHGGFKTRHLYPPRDLYDTTASLCGAVVVGSCRIGQTNEVSLEKLRREAADFWTTAERRRRNGGGGAKAKRRPIDSDADGSDSGSERSDSDRGGSSGTGGSSDGSGGSSGSDSNGSSSSDDDDDDGNLTDSESNSDGSGSGSGSGSGGSDSRGSRSSGSGGGKSTGSAGSSGKEGSSQRKIVSGGGRRGGGARRSRRHRETKHGESRRIQSPGSDEPVDNDNKTADRRSGDNSEPAIARRKRALALGSGGNVASGQQFAKGDTRACTAVYDRAHYEDTMSVFGRAVRDALRGQCIENIDLSRVLVVHLYNFLRRECAPFERPRMSVAEEEEAEEGQAAGVGGKQEKVGRKKKEVAERKAKKEAEKAEARRRAKLGAKAAAEELRKKKEAAMLRETEEEKRRRTQVGGGFDFRLIEFFDDRGRSLFSFWSKGTVVVVFGECCAGRTLQYFT